jgi:hypothetical protein
MSPTAYRLSLRVNGDTGSNYKAAMQVNDTNFLNPIATQWNVFQNNDMGTTATRNFYSMTFLNYTSTANYKVNAGNGFAVNTDGTDNSTMGTFLYKSTSAITSITILSEGQAANFSGGTYELFGVK